MTRKKTKKSKLTLALAAAAMIPLSMTFGLGSFRLAKAEDETSSTYISSYRVDISDNITNPSFKDGSTPYDDDDDGAVGNWKAINPESNANGMIIDVGRGSSSEGDGQNSTFSRYQEDYYCLDRNPLAELGDDSRILMINSKTPNSTSNNNLANKGFRSSEITLSPNSFYSFSFAVKTALNSDSSVFASAYLTGMVDEDGSPLKIGYEHLNNTQWHSYEIYVATGNEEQTVTLDFYLGTNSGEYSSGVVFFDEVSLTQYSANAFISSAIIAGYSSDNFSDLTSSETKFLVTTLLDADENIVDESFNFDFENEITSSNTISPAWNVKESQSGHARVMRLQDPTTNFKTQTGYDYIGMDLSYDILNSKQNSQALVLFTDKNANSGYVSVQSKAIDINPHQIYKISASVKVASIESGSFTLGINEVGKTDDGTQGIYSYYPSLENSSYSLQSGQTSGLTSNTTNNFTNNYQTVELYVKGHSLYKSSFNVVLSLGSSSTSAKGCVVVDNIKISTASYEEYNNATNKYELSSFTTENENNSYFNSTQAAQTGYPVAATNYTSEIEDEKYNTAGVIYLYNQTMFEQMYSGYDWATFFPGNPPFSAQTNNVYMMHNSSYSYQSLTSPTLTLDANSYQKISFDFYTQSKTASNLASISVEIVDENGIVLFEQDGIESADHWSKFEVVFHTAETVSSTVTVKISFGTQDDEKVGTVYIDNVLLSASSSSEYQAAANKNDVSDYFLSFESDKLTGDANTSSTTTAYEFSVDEALDGGNLADSQYAVGAMVNGQNNVYAVENDKNLLVITTRRPSTATLRSVFPITLSSSTYYKLTFDLQTLLPDKDELEDEHDYGVSISIDGFEVISNLTSDTLETFTVYLNSSSAATAEIVFSLTSDSMQTLGTAILTNIDITESSQIEFNSATIAPDYQEKVFQSNYISSDSNEDTGEEETPDADDTTEPTNSVDPWLLIGSIIMTLAIIVALVAVLLKKIKIKRKPRLEKSGYDRKLSIDLELVANEAKRRRDQQLSELFENKKSLQNEKTTLEEQHKFFVQESRVANKGKITKEIEKEFKSYASSINKIEEKLAIIDEQIAAVSSPDHLIEIEKDVMQEEEYRLKQERKANIEKQKEQKKADQDDK